MPLAQSSQVFARNFNGIATPLVAPAPIAPVARFAAPAFAAPALPYAAAPALPYAAAPAVAAPLPYAAAAPFPYAAAYSPYAAALRYPGYPYAF